MTKNAKRKLRIKTLNKQYSLEDSVFYKLNSKKRLAQALGTDLPTLSKLRSDDLYNCFQDTSSGKPRDIEHPTGILEVIHTRIASLLCRITQPDYMHSGIKGRSHITNAKSHVGLHPVLATDLKSFFQSTTRKQVFGFFYNIMQCSSDVADLLSRICTCHDHIPTGSRISMPLAYWANSGLFNKLSSISESNGTTMTVFVDDLTFSGNKVNRQFRQRVNNVISKAGHIMHPDKTRLHKPTDTKVITGVAVNSDCIKVRHKQHLDIYTDMESWLAIKDIPALPELREQLYRRILGRLNSQAQIDRRFKDKARTFKQSL